MTASPMLPNSAATQQKGLGADYAVLSGALQPPVAPVSLEEQNFRECHEKTAINRICPHPLEIILDQAKKLNSAAE